MVPQRTVASEDAITSASPSLPRHRRGPKRTAHAIPQRGRAARAPARMHRRRQQRQQRRESKRGGRRNELWPVVPTAAGGTGRSVVRTRGNRPRNAPRCRTWRGARSKRRRCWRHHDRVGRRPQRALLSVVCVCVCVRKRVGREKHRSGRPSPLPDTHKATCWCDPRAEEPHASSIVATATAATEGGGPVLEGDGTSSETAAWKHRASTRWQCWGHWKLTANCKRKPTRRMGPWRAAGEDVSCPRAVARRIPHGAAAAEEKYVGHEHPGRSRLLRRRPRRHDARWHGRAEHVWLGALQPCATAPGTCAQRAAAQPAHGWLRRLFACAQGGLVQLCNKAQRDGGGASRSSVHAGSLAQADQRCLDDGARQHLLLVVRIGVGRQQLQQVRTVELRADIRARVKHILHPV